MNTWKVLLIALVVFVVVVAGLFLLGSTGLHGALGGGAYSS